MKKIIIPLVIAFIIILVLTGINQINLVGKLDKETGAVKQMQDQSAKQSVDLIKFQSCASLADLKHNATGEYYSVIECVHKDLKK